MTQAEIINRIEAEAKAFEDKNPYDAIHSAYYMGAKSERNKVLDEATGTHLAKSRLIMEGKPYVRLF